MPDVVIRNIVMVVSCVAILARVRGRAEVRAGVTADAVASREPWI
tara:strand:+ start:180688 stop:180822 length:135 start_codon:yes stop_codon:yes gene_type:complete